MGRAEPTRCESRDLLGNLDFAGISSPHVYRFRRLSADIAPAMQLRGIRWAHVEHQRRELSVAPYCDDSLFKRRKRMKNFGWFLLAAGAVAIGSMAISLAPDIARYVKIRSM
jgi:hypothetical protein